MTKKIEGGCLCGAIRYEFDCDPLVSLNCHCRHCQMTSGSTHLVGIVLPRDKLTFSGDPTWFDTEPERGGTARRAFCATCGTAVFGYSEGTDVIVVHTVTLDDPGNFRPEMDIYTSSAQPWVQFDADLPSFSKMPPMGED